MMQAGRILIQEIKGRIERNESFAYDKLSDVKRDAFVLRFLKGR